ncbi:hypothetical protein EVAR_4565_1 [Eumeta japonica]|uniref:Uncharacterized protein n=1 Tax=Eumeta variegata TaxID=151549 RepID=A0A4C1SYR7_EUMVA|nr:hypothetical protein EVAR_4565_1 [Eumeta japonica]
MPGFGTRAQRHTIRNLRAAACPMSFYHRGGSILLFNRTPLISIPTSFKFDYDRGDRQTIIALRGYWQSTRISPYTCSRESEE